MNVSARPVVPEAPICVRHPVRMLQRAELHVRFPGGRTRSRPNWLPPLGRPALESTVQAPAFPSPGSVRTKDFKQVAVFAPLETGTTSLVMFAPEGEDEVVCVVDLRPDLFPPVA